MAPSRKRAAKAPAPSAAKKSKMTSKAAAKPSSSKKTPLAFETFCDMEEGCVTGDGLAALASELEIDASSDTKLLAMCWRLGAEKPGVLSEEEWARFGTCPALPTYGDATLETLKSGWGSLDPAFLDNSEFRPFFKFCFEFNRDGTKKFLERDTALALLPLCIENRSPHTPAFVRFLESKPEDLVLNRDQWVSFLDFSLTVGAAPAFKGWDAEESSWPILLDEFVDFAKAELTKTKSDS